MFCIILQTQPQRNSNRIYQEKLKIIFEILNPTNRIISHVDSIQSEPAEENREEKRLVEVDMRLSTVGGELEFGNFYKNLN